MLARKPGQQGTDVRLRGYGHDCVPKCREGREALEQAVEIRLVRLVGDEHYAAVLGFGGDDPTIDELLVDTEIGRDNAFFDNYRPQVRFSADRREVTCAVRIPKPREKVDPGETAEVALNCLDPFRTFEEDKAFVVFEGGRKVAEGRLN